LHILSVNDKQTDIEGVTEAEVCNVTLLTDTPLPLPEIRRCIDWKELNNMVGRSEHLDFHVTEAQLVGSRVQVEGCNQLSIHVLVSSPE
jgi:hypothetical protein